MHQRWFGLVLVVVVVVLLFCWRCLAVMASLLVECAERCHRREDERSGTDGLAVPVVFPRRGADGRTDESTTVVL